jgi:HK97 family phage major capsid protein
MASRYAILQETRVALLEESRALFAKADFDSRALTDAEQRRDDEISAKMAEVDAELARWERQRSREREEVASLVPDVKGGRGGDPNQFSSMGEFLQAIVCYGAPVLAPRIPNYQGLLNKLNLYAAASGMSVGSPSDGGHLVRKDWTMDMMNKARENSVLFQRCRNVPIGGDFDGLEYPFIDETSRVTGSRWGGVQVYWKAEANTVTAKQPKIGKGELRLEEMMGLAYATERLIRDGAALEAILRDGFESEVAFMLDDAIIRGDGAGKPKGFFASECLVSVAKESAQAADTVVAGNITKMWARMPARLQGGAVWLIHQEVTAQLPLMTIGQMPVWLPPGNLTSAPNGLLMGRPVIPVEQCEKLGDKGDIFLANLGEYVVITKANEGVRYDTSMHVRFLYDEMAFRWVFRVNGQPIWRQSLTPYKGTDNLSPFITLDDRA